MSYLDKFKLSALVASIGFNDGANKGFWRIQPRAAKGRQGAGQWIEMGAELRALLKVNGKLVSVIGRSVGSNGTPDGVRVMFQGLADKGIPDSIVEIPTRFLDLVSASIPEELLKKKGILSPDVAPESDQDVPNFEDLQRAEITPDDIRIANEGINSPEGKEQAAFKDSAEGKAIEEEEAIDSAIDKVMKAMDTGTEEEQIAANEELRKAREVRDSKLKDPADMTDEELQKESSSPMPTNMKRSNKIFEEINKRAGRPSASERRELERQRYEQEMAEEQRVKDIVEPIYESLFPFMEEEGLFDAFNKAQFDDILTGDEKLQAIANAIKSQKLGEMKGSKEKARQAQYKALKTLEAEGVDVGNINRTGSTPAEDLEIDGPNGRVTPRMRQAAAKKAIQDAIDGKTVTPDDVINYAKGEPEFKPLPKGQKMDLKPTDMKPGDIFDYRGEDYIFESAGERDRVSKTQDVTATNRRTGESEDVLLDTDRTTQVLRPSAVQPEPEPTPAPKAEAPKAPEVAPEVAPEAPATPAAPEAPATPEPVAERPADINTVKPAVKKSPALPRKPKVPTPIEKARDEGRQDKGELISLPDISEEELFKEKIRPLIDENGNPLEFFNPATGKVQVAGNADAIEEAIFKKFPNAVVTKQGQILLERKDLESLTGEPAYLSMFIERTHGNGFYVGFNLTNKADFDPENPIKGDSYYHHDIRDSFASIFGKTNGLLRISRIFSGQESPIENKNSKQYKSYFAPGKTFNDRLKYFRSNSKAKEEQLIEGLRQAKRDKNATDILRFKTDLRLLRVDFNGDMNKFREYDSLQNYRIITLSEMYDRYSAGRAGYNNKSLDQLERQQRSAIKGVYEAIASGDRGDATASLQELAYRTPMLSRNKIAADVMLKSISNGFKTRLPKENKRTLGALKTNAFLALQDSQSIEAQKGAPHMSQDGIVLKPGFLIEYTSNDKKKTKSIGTVVGLRQLARGRYTDKVYVVFKNSKGSKTEFTPPIELVSTRMTVLDETGYSERDPQSALKLPGTREQMTQYTPDIGGLELVEQRGGEKAVKAKLAYINSRQSDPNELDNPDEDPELDSPNLGSEGVEGDEGDGDLPDGYKRTEDLIAGDILYSKDGDVLGQIVSIKPVKSKSGKAAFAVQFIDENGDVGKPVILQPGEIRGPKA